MTPRQCFLCIVLAAVLAGPFAVAGAAPRIAIIIDDLGYRLDAGERAIALPGPVACAILPTAPAAARLAAAAERQGKEILLHLPMQSMRRDGAGEPEALTMDMSRVRLAGRFSAALAEVPNAIGVNNHRGSLLTRHPVHMQWLMKEIRDRAPLFFVDSYTTHKSVALAMAHEAGVPAIKRDVFLDSDPAPAKIRAELQRLEALARTNGSAVAIGHPYDATLSVLESWLPTLSSEGIELVPISALVANKAAATRSKPQRKFHAEGSGLAHD